MINKYDQEANPSHKHIFLWCWIDSRICILPQQIVSARHATLITLWILSCRKQQIVKIDQILVAHLGRVHGTCVLRHRCPVSPV